MYSFHANVCQAGTSKFLLLFFEIRLVDVVVVVVVQVVMWVGWAEGGDADIVVSFHCSYHESLPISMASLWIVCTSNLKPSRLMYRKQEIPSLRTCMQIAIA
jgi:hypothetical protein